MITNHVPAVVLLCFILMIVALAVLDPDNGIAAVKKMVTLEEFFLALD